MIERRTPLKRTPMKRGTSIGLTRATKPIAAVSKTKKRRREQKAGPSMSELRPLLWERAGQRCERCNRSLSYETFDAHHRKFRSRGGLDRIENLVALCIDCHRWAHGPDAMAVAHGFSVLRHEDPALIPLKIPFGLPVYLTEEGTYTRKTPTEGTS